MIAEDFGPVYTRARPAQSAIGTIIDAWVEPKSFLTPTVSGLVKNAG